MKRRAARGGPLVVLTILVVLGCDRIVDDAGPREALRQPIQGVDVSHHQGEIDWRAVADAGIGFVWMKATEGGDHRDAMFRRNWTLAAAAGLKRGAYHFVYWCRRAEEQAAWFIANVPADPDALPPVLDAEWNIESKTCPQPVPKETALATMKIILAAMERTFGQKPLIYAPRDFFHDVMEGEFLGYPLWVRGLKRDPAAAYDGRTGPIWQFSDTGVVAGIPGTVDRNAFVGSRTIWRRWIADRNTW